MNKSNKIPIVVYAFFLTLIIIFNSFQLFSQEIKSSNFNRSNIYNCGVTIVSCKDNFENLFSNWNRWIKTDSNIDLISYDYVAGLQPAHVQS